MENLPKSDFNKILDKLSVDEQNQVLKLIALNDLQGQALKSAHVVFKDIDLLIKKFNKFEKDSLFVTDFYKIAEQLFGMKLDV